MGRRGGSGREWTTVPALPASCKATSPEGPDRSIGTLCATVLKISYLTIEYITPNIF